MLDQVTLKVGVGRGVRGAYSHPYHLHHQWLVAWWSLVVDGCMVLLACPGSMGIGCWEFVGCLYYDFTLRLIHFYSWYQGMVIMMLKAFKSGDP